MDNNIYSAPQTNPAGSPPNADVAQLPVIPGLENLQYPLQFSFKIVALAPQLMVTDATGRQVVYIKQKLFRFKEKVEIFTDKSKSTKLGNIQANKVIDWSARYFFTNANDEPIGSVGRKGMRSLWKASYDTFTTPSDHPDFKLTEENPMVKVFDALLGEIPVLGFATAFLFHPKYAAAPSSNPDAPKMRLTKKPAFFEGKFELEKLGELDRHQETNLIMSFIMLVLLERARG